MKKFFFVKKNWDSINDESFRLEKNLEYINRFTDSAASGKNLTNLTTYYRFKRFGLE